MRTRVYLVNADDFDGFARAHAEVFGDVRPANTTVLAGLFDPSWKVEIEVEAVLRDASRRSRPRSPATARSLPSVLDHKFGAGDPYTLGVEEEYQLLDPQTFDLVQHIDTMLEAVTGHELEARINAELMQSVLEITTPVCHNAGDVMRWLTKLAATSRRSHTSGTRAWVGRHAPVQPLRATARSPRRTATTR